jgi:hypothetical protein
MPYPLAEHIVSLQTPLAKDRLATVGSECVSPTSSAGIADVWPARAEAMPKMARAMGSLAEKENNMVRSGIPNHT